MTKEEAIKELRSFIGQLTEGCQEAIRVLIPEVAESDDEKIRKGIMYQCCKMCIFSSYRGHFCEHWNRRTSANKGWCKDIILKKKKNARKEK